MRWPSPLTDAEAHAVEDMFPRIIAIAEEQMTKYGVGDQYKKLILANGFAGAVDAVMQWKAVENKGSTPHINLIKFADEKIKLSVLEGIDNITVRGSKAHPVQSPPVAKRPGSAHGNQRHR